MQAPRKGSCGHYSIVPADLPIVGAVEPTGKASFTLTGSERGSKALTWVPTVDFALEFPGLPSLRLGVLNWNHNQVIQTQKLPPGARHLAWIGRLFPQG